MIEINTLKDLHPIIEAELKMKRDFKSPIRLYGSKNTFSKFNDYLHGLCASTPFSSHIEASESNPIAIDEIRYGGFTFEIIYV